MNKIQQKILAAIIVPVMIGIIGAIMFISVSKLVGIEYTNQSYP